MITSIALLTAREGLSHAEFVDYYESHHVPLVLSSAPAPASYSRSYLPPRDQRTVPSDFDVVTRLQFATLEERASWIAQVYAPDSGVAEDENRFLRRSLTRSWVVDEWASGPGGR